MFVFDFATSTGASLVFADLKLNGIEVLSSVSERAKSQGIRMSSRDFGCRTYSYLSPGPAAAARASGARARWARASWAGACAAFGLMLRPHPCAAFGLALRPHPGEL